MLHHLRYRSNVLPNNYVSILLGRNVTSKRCSLKGPSSKGATLLGRPVRLQAAALLKQGVQCLTSDTDMIVTVSEVGQNSCKAPDVQ